MLGRYQQIIGQFARLLGILVINCCCWGAILSLVPSASCRAGSFGLKPSISLNSGYDDNILFNNTKPVTDVYVSAKPELNIGLASDLYTCNLIAYTEQVRYLEETDLDYESYHSELTGEVKFSPRWNYSGAFSYTQDTTLQSELEEAGRVSSREERSLMQADNELAYDLNELSAIGIEYQYRTIEYESDERIDRFSHRARIPYHRWFNNRLDRLTLRPSYTRTETEDSRTIDYYNFSAGWLHRFSQTLRMRNFIGYGYATTTQDDDQDSTQSGSFDLSLTLNDEIYSLRIGLRSNLRVDAEGELREVDRLYCRLRKKMTERLSTSINGGVYINRSPDNYESVDSVFYDIRPEMSYELTEKHFLNVFYRHSLEEDQTVTEDRYSVRNIIEINFVFQFPVQY